MQILRRNWMALAGIFSVAMVAVVVAINALATPQPVLKITSLGGNQFSIVITNAVTTTNYTLFWTPALGDPNYLWQVLGVGNIGETNFTVDGGGWNNGYFKVLLGTDSDGDGVPEWQDAQPGNPAVGILSITIDSPTYGMLFQ